MALHSIIQTEAWRLALEKYGAATGLTVVVFESPEHLILGPIHSTVLFEAIAREQDAPPMFLECVRQCLCQNTTTPTIVDDNGVAVLGIRLSLAGQEIGAVVAGYALTNFPEEAIVQRFSQRHGLQISALWRTIRRQAPLTRRRLEIYTDLLGALTETLLSENVRSQQHQDAATRLAEAVRAKDEFLAMLAHELRNPLAPIRIAMQVLAAPETSNRSLSDSAFCRAREIVDRQVQHLTRLLDDLLDVSRITTGKIDLRKETIDLATVVANALDESRSQLDERGHALSVSLPDEPILIEADLDRLEQVITNLVNNAAKYTPPQGHIGVTVSREGGEAVLRVRDDGVGMSADVVPRVFDLFTQADRSLARSEGGLGIGLTIVRNLVELHGGTVTATSEGPGLGSEFVVRLPLGTVRRAPAAVSPREETVIPRLRILVVEDNADGRDILRTMLEVEGHEVHVAEDGLSGVETARTVRPHVALIDIGLPGLDGYEVGKRIRGEQGNSIRLVALTGYGQAEDRRRSREAGFDAHLVKPVAPDQLREALVERSKRSSAA
jgi:signal transduction histidine kinase/ActR/RegA family two-component response regulator